MTNRGRTLIDFRALQLISSNGPTTATVPPTLPTLPIPPPSPSHSLIATLEAARDPQNACVLFTILPPEIRNNIFSLALCGYDDKDRPYPEYSYYSRPGYRFHRRIDTALLATCQRIYRETHDLPISQNEHVFWFKRGPSVSSLGPAQYFERFTVEQQSAVKQVHFFTQLFWLEKTFPMICKLSVVKAKHIKVTVRHTDWWYWESNAPLVMKSQWVDNLRYVVGLQSLEVELETIEQNKAQMEDIALNMLRWKIPLVGQVLTTEGNPIVSQKIQGTTRYSDSSLEYSTARGRWVRIENINEPPEPRHLPYVVLTLLWTAKARRQESEMLTQ